MKRILLVTALMAATAAFAQQPVDVPKLKCEPKPVLPGPRMREETSAMKGFNRDLDKYKQCMTAYLDERKAAIKANEEAANAAVKEFNDTMKALNDAQKSG